jgi:hypothetical protein
MAVSILTQQPAIGSWFPSPGPILTLGRIAVRTSRRLLVTGEPPARQGASGAHDLRGVQCRAAVPMAAIRRYGSNIPVRKSRGC